MLNKMILWGPPIILFLAGSLFFFSCKRSCSFQQKQNWLVKKISSKLDLNDSQKSRLKQIAAEIKVQRLKFKSAKDEIVEEVLAQIKSDSMDSAKINAMFDKKQDEFKKFRSFLIAKAAQFHGILTAQQRNKAYEKIMEIREKHGKRCWH